MEEMVAVMGLAVLVIERSAVTTLVVSLVVLSDKSVSVWADVTEALLVVVGVVDAASPPTNMDANAPGWSVPTSHVTVVAVSTHGPACDADENRKSIPAGRRSVIVTPVAMPGPAFETDIE